MTTDAAPRGGWYFDWPGWTIVVHAPDDLLRDAARYRWVRDELSPEDFATIPAEELDAFIDAEIARERGR